MPKYQVDLTRMILFEFSNGEDVYIGYSTDLTRRKQFMKNKTMEGHPKLVFERIREKGLPFSEWKMEEIEKMSASDIKEVIKRRNELVLTKNANLNKDDTRFDPAHYKKEWRRNRRLSALTSKEKCPQEEEMSTKTIKDTLIEK